MRQLAPEGSARRRIVAGHWITAAVTRLTGLNDKREGAAEGILSNHPSSFSRLSNLLLLFIQGHARRYYCIEARLVLSK